MDKTIWCTAKDNYQHRSAPSHLVTSFVYLVYFAVPSHHHFAVLAVLCGQASLDRIVLNENKKAAQCARL